MQLGQIDLLMAMYPDEGSVVLTEAAGDALVILRQWLTEEDFSESLSSLPQAIDFVMQLDVAGESSTSQAEDFKLSISLPIRCSEAARSLDCPPAPKARVQQSYWMSKAEAALLTTKIPRDEDLISMIEHVNQYAALYLAESRDQPQDELMSPSHAIHLSRVWFYFPSISTRSKRDDLVNTAPVYDLTGFLLAGKPGILCLEGDSQAIDDYMKFIKTESWGDIPSGHKKVSERLRESVQSRVFANMEEITDQLERRGERANRNDMKALEAWLDERGLRDAFAKILI